MYLYIGQNTVLPDSSVIGVFDIDKTTESKITRAYLTNAEKGGKIENVAEDIPRSFVVSCDGGREAVYLSQLSPETLKKRSENFTFE